MKVELNGTWLPLSQFFNVAVGKSGTASYVIELAPPLKNKSPSVEVPPVPEALKSSLEELEKAEGGAGGVAEVRGIILHKLIVLTQAKEMRSSLLEFLLHLLNSDTYPRADLKSVGCALAGLCFGLGKVTRKGETLSAKDALSTTTFPGATKGELEILTSKDASRIVPLFLQVFKLPVTVA